RLVRWNVPEQRDRAQLLGRRDHVVAPRWHDCPRLLLRVEDRADHHHRANRVRLELERRDDSEVAARAAYGPEDALVLGCARFSQLTVCSDDVDRAEAVDREPELAAQVADPAVR